MDYPKLPKKCKSLLCKYLTPKVFDTLKNKKTINGFTLELVINSGVQNIDSSIGVYAGDEESYTTFAALFDPIIKEYHGFDTQDKHTSNLNPDDLNTPNPDSEGKFIVSTRIRVGRNIDNMHLGAVISQGQRDLVESTALKALSALEGELAGNYYPLLGMTKELQDDLYKEHLLFKEGDRFLDAAGYNRNWPDGRGIYHNHDKTFLVWINEEDQLRIISIQQGGDIKEVFIRLVSALKVIETEVTFAYNNHLGYITSCPTNLGTAMRASVHITLPNLAKDMDAFKAITDKYYLQIRGINGEHSANEGSVYDISNQRRLGITEVQAVQNLHDGVVALIGAEKTLAPK